MVEKLRKIHEANKHVDLKSLTSLYSFLPLTTEELIEKARVEIEAEKEKDNTAQVVKYLLELFDDPKLDILHPTISGIIKPLDQYAKALELFTFRYSCLARENQRVFDYDSEEEIQNLVKSDVDYFAMLLSLDKYSREKSKIKNAFNEIFEHHNL